MALTVLVVIVALWISSVHARVVVKVRHETTQLQTTVEVAKSPVQGQLQGRVVTGTFEKIQEFGVNDSSSTLPEDLPVAGTVKIVNNYSKAQALIKTTRLLTTDGRLYRIDKTVVVPSKQSVNVAAHSDKSGSAYVLAAGTRLVIPGLWAEMQKYIYAEAVSGFSGGTQISKIVTDMDVNSAQKTLQDAVLEQAKKTLRAEAGVGDDWNAVFTTKTVDQKSNAATGQKSDEFLASVKLDVTAVFYPSKDMDVLVQQKLKERLPDGRELTDYNPSLVTYHIEQTDVPNETARISISAQAGSRLTTNSPGLSKDAVAGLSLSDAKAKLESLDGVDSVDIQIRPSWIGKLPTMQNHIDLLVQ